jgi:hypothetical protein
MNNPAHCKKAIKILVQYERLAQKLGIHLSAARIATLNRLRDAGLIRSTDLPAKLRIDFPGEFVGMTLGEIRRACGM